jgi:hypothetical protein
MQKGRMYGRRRVVGCILSSDVEVGLHCCEKGTVRSKLPERNMYYRSSPALDFPLLRKKSITRFAAPVDPEWCPVSCS